MIDDEISAAKARLTEVKVAQATERGKIQAEQAILAERLRHLDKEISPFVDEYGDLLKKRFMASEYARRPGEEPRDYQARLRALRARDRAAGTLTDDG